MPTLGDPRFDRQARAHGRRQDGFAPRGGQRLEQLPARHRDTAHCDAFGLQALRRRDDQSDLGAARDQDHLGLPPGRIREHVCAAAQTLCRRVAIAVERRHVLPGQHQGDRVSPGLQRDAPRHRRFVRVAGPNHDQVRNRAQRGELLHGLVRRPVLAERDAVVGEHVHDVQLRQGGQPNWRAHVLGEDQKGRPVRDGPAVRGHSVRDRAHRVLADAEVDVAPAVARAGLVRAFGLQGVDRR